VSRRKALPPDVSDVSIDRVLGVDGEVGIRAITRYGTARDQLIVVTLADDREIRFERPGDLYSPDAIVQIASNAGLKPKLITKGVALAFAQAVIDAADIKMATDARVEHETALATFLHRAEAAKTIEFDLDHDAQTYKRFLELRDYVFAIEGRVEAAYRSAVLLEKHGDRYVRVSDLMAHFREQLKRGVSYEALKAVALEAGWRWPGPLWKRKPVAIGSHPGPPIVRINVAIAEAGWEDRGAPPETPQLEGPNA
jgi:hypothetical protein